MSTSAYNRLSVEDKMAKVMVNLRRLRPYYSAVYEVMEKVETPSVKTMGVNLKQLAYNPEFVNKISFEELMFVSLHEIAHIALMHVTRGKDKNHKIWNIAGDLYINAMLVDEFKGCDLVTMPKDILYCSSIDLDEESVDDIYNELMRQMSEIDNEMFKESKNKGRVSKIGQQSDEEDSGQGNNNQPTGDKQQSDEIITGTFGNIGYSSKKAKLSYIGKKPIGKDTDKFEMDINRVHIYDCDVDSESQSTGSETLDEQEARKILSDADVKARMMGEVSVGSGSNRLEQFIRETLRSKMDWRSLLRKYCIALRSSETSFARPDKRMYYQSAIYPGNEIEESNFLKDIKVAIDTSGSVTDEYLMYVYGQIKDILNQYKVNGELILWDWEINSTGDFNDFKGASNIAIKSRGGTRPDCIFEYMDSKQCKIKPALTLVFTDGEFFGFEENQNMNKWKKKYKDTIWVMTKEYNKMFKPPFGRLAYAKF